MSRSGYSDDCDDVLAAGRWSGMVASAIRGKRGQALLKELADALDAMPEKKLITEELKCENGVCALGAVGERRGLKMEEFDPYDSEGVAETFNIAEPLAREIVYYNDEYFNNVTPTERWIKMRAWVQARIKKTEAE